RIREGLSATARLDLGNDRRIAADGICDAAQYPAALERDHVGPRSMIEGAPSSGCRGIYVLRPSTGDLGIERTGQRANDVEILAPHACGEFAIYQQLGLEHDGPGAGPHVARGVTQCNNSLRSEIFISACADAAGCSVNHTVRNPSAFGPITSLSRLSPTNTVSCGRAPIWSRAC